MKLPKSMHAVVYRGPNDLRLETVSVPRIRAGELLVKVGVCGVCPTDIKKIHYGTVPPPRIFGHETAGVIVQTGAGVKQFRVGDRVALHHHVPCLDCHYCRHHAYAQCPGYKRTGITAGFEPAGGGYAEYVRVMPFVLPGVVRIPDKNSLIEGAMLEPVNTVLKGIKRLNILAGDTVMVIGQGPIGLMFTRLLALQGIKVLATDLLDTRLRLARQWGAKWAMRGDKYEIRNPKSETNQEYEGEISKTGSRSENRKQMRTSIASSRGQRNPTCPPPLASLAVQNGFPCIDAAIVAVPSEAAVHQAIAMTRPSGQVLLFAHTKARDCASIDLGMICALEKDLIGSYSSDFALQDEVARLVFSRRLDMRPLITHRFPLAETAAAVALAAKPTAESLKVVVEQGIEI